MDTKPTTMNVFLSASIPRLDQEKDARFYETADIVAIRDAVIALAETLLPEYHLIWGGHPSITPLISKILEKRNMNSDSICMTLYQSSFFKGNFPKENINFTNVIYTKSIQDNRLDSLNLMRQEMIGNNEFSAAIFIGGMDGVIDEYEIFKEKHPKTQCFPLASTGAAAIEILHSHKNEYSEKIFKSLSENYNYQEVFKHLFFKLA